MTKDLLIIEDDPAAREVLGRFLASAGYRIEFAAEGRAGLERLGHEPAPDAILLDLMMPVMSGFEVLSALRVNQGWAGIPVVVLTATGGYSAEHLGVAAIVLKPFTAAGLQAAVELALQG